MSFGVAELVVQAVVQDGLTNLRQNPHHLEYILNAYSDIEYIRRRVGANFIRNAMDMLIGSELAIRPYYVENIDTYPCLIISASYNEDQKYIGDYGSVETFEGTTYDDARIQPHIYATFSASSIYKDEIRVPKSYNIEDAIFLGLWVVNQTTTAVIKRIQISDTETILHLDRSLPDGLPLEGWEAKTLPGPLKAKVNASTNGVSIQMALFTSGDAELHRVYAQVIRYCLKRGRKLFDHYGLQDIDIAQQPPTVASDEGPMFRTMFSVNGVELDTWIEYDINPPERLTLDLAPVNDDTKKAPV